MDKPVVLTAEDAETLIWLISGLRNTIRRDKSLPDVGSPGLKAIATGRTVVVPVELLRRAQQHVPYLGETYQAIAALLPTGEKG